MKRALVLGLVIFTAVTAFAATLKIDDLLKNADRHDGNVLTVTGKVADFRVRTSRADREYTTFKLQSENKEINVYLRGRVKGKVENGNMVEVTGTFRKEKKVNDNFTVKNEVDASPTGRANDKNGVKVISTSR
ncbi:MAG: cytochrome c maturation protein CcmE [Fimbriimonadaceae bacterium]|jgi:cytochrome c-type biogenesis protein CcmE|nr:cytochrome c maturation protein CcmE [Fimbriimonadaceae bacterium]